MTGLLIPYLRSIQLNMWNFPRALYITLNKQMTLFVVEITTGHIREKILGEAGIYYS